MSEAEGFSDQRRLELVGCRVRVRFRNRFGPCVEGDELPVIDWLAGKTGGVTHANRLQKMLDEEQARITQSYTPAGTY